MMNIDLIKSFAVNSNYYSTNIGPYVIPTFIFLKGKRINLIENRDHELNSPDSSYVRKFKEDVADIGSKVTNILPDYIEEFPVVISDRRLWNEALDYYGVSADSEFRGRLYFLTDFLFYKSGFIVEIDSSYHQGRELYDLARDYYIKSKYGLKTIRFYEYDSNRDYGIIENILRNYFRLANAVINTIGREYHIDQSEAIVDSYMIDNRKSLEFVESLIKYVNASPITEKIAITMKDVSMISPELSDIFCDPSQRMMFLSNVQLTLKCIYEIDFYVQDTIEFSWRDVMWVISINNSRDKWRNLSLTTNRPIPKWMISILGEIPKKLRKVILVDKRSCGNSGIEEYLKVLYNS